MPGGARGLYRRILLLHRALPAALRALGDRYVKEEFRKHKAAGPAEAQRFLREWEASARRPAGSDGGRLPSRVPPGAPGPAAWPSLPPLAGRGQAPAREGAPASRSRWPAPR